MYFLTLPYSRNFTIGRGSEQLYNEELHKIYESIKHLTDTPPVNTEPTPKMGRSMWHDLDKNQLKWWDSTEKKWRRYFENEFRITDEIMSVLPPDNPVKGELWIYNGTLCYFDGSQWAPIKALIQDGSQFSLDMFKNFLLISPLWKIGNMVVKDSQVEAFEEEMRKYLQGKLDSPTDADSVGDGTKWNFEHTCDYKSPTIPDIKDDVSSQLLVPNIDYARMFLNHQLDTEKYQEISKVCIQYKTKDLISTTPSLVHLNPGRLTKITKRLIKVDRNAPRIQVPTENTEYYGFHANDYFGDFLLPDSSTTREDGTIDVTKEDYTVVEDGILLSYNASQNYDYVLAITYEFSWMKSTGHLSKKTNSEHSTSFYIDKFNAPFNVFVEGYNYEDPYYEVYGQSKTIELKEDVSELEVSVMHVPKREYGYIRQIDIQNRGIVRPLKEYVRPMLFVNGEALSSVSGDYSYDKDRNLFYIANAKDDMAYCIIDLHEEPCERNGYTPYDAEQATGTVGANKLIDYSVLGSPNTEDIILYIDGLLIKKEDIIYDRANKTINVAGSGLRQEQTYIIVEDKFGWLYDESALQPALPVGSFSESLVYMNNHLLCNNTAIDCYQEPYADRINPDGSITKVPYTGAFNEVKNFKVVYDEVVEVANKAALDSLVSYNNGRNSSVIEDEIEAQVRKSFVGKPNVTEADIVAAVKSEQTKKVIRSGILYYCKDTGCGYIAEKDNNDTTYPCSYNLAFSADDGDSRTIQRNSKNDIVKIICNRYRIYDNVNRVWNKLDDSFIPGLSYFAYAYENLPRSVHLILPYKKDVDKLDIYAFSLSNAIEHPLQIYNTIVVNQDEIKTQSQYVYGANTLRVWCNGVRQYPNAAGDGEPANGIIEQIDGKSFKLPEKFTGHVTYIIELPENNQAKACTMEVLDNSNIPSGYINLYKTKLPMFPGRVSVYINGVRQPKESYTVFDNYTLFIDSDKPLTGSDNNYPDENIYVGNKKYTVHHDISDKILVEVRTDNRVEQTVTLDKHPVYEIDVEKYEIPADILETSDEVLIFVDGLYYGPPLNGDNYDKGYTLNIPRCSVVIQQDDSLAAMNTDELSIYLKAHPEEARKYVLVNGKEYERHNATVTLEWR